MEQVILEQFLHSYKEVFSVKDVYRDIRALGYSVTQKELKQFVDSNPCVFALEKDLYITRAGVFTGEIFSIKPTPYEIAHDVFIPGARCLPFVDSDLYSCLMDFKFKGQKLPTKAVEIDSDLAIDLFCLYGEEYAAQYIAADPANESLDLVEKGFMLPNTVMLTGIDISQLKKKYGFSSNDRLLCRVKDWCHGVIDIEIVHDRYEENRFDSGEAGEKRLHWYALVEKYLLEGFDKFGPCGCIDEQLASMFFVHKKELCIPECGSLMEFLNEYSRKVKIEYFGVETRLWKKGELVPAVGLWNKSQMENSGGNSSPFDSEAEQFLLTMPPFVFDQFVEDMYFRRSEDYDELVKRMLPYQKKPDSYYKTRILLNLDNRNDILKKSYNWFADQVIGPVRQNALLLYTEVAYLVYKIDGLGCSLESFPQQELVILSQLFNHLTRVLESISNKDHIEEEAESLLMSLEGMRINFEGISEALEHAVIEQKKSRFKLFRKEEN